MPSSKRRGNLHLPHCIAVVLADSGPLGLLLVCRDGRKDARGESTEGGEGTRGKSPKPSKAAVAFSDPRGRRTGLSSEALLCPPSSKESRRCGGRGWGGRGGAAGRDILHWDTADLLSLSFGGQRSLLRFRSTSHESNPSPTRQKQATANSPKCQKST